MGWAPIDSHSGERIMSFLEVDDLSVADKLALLDNACATNSADMTWVHVEQDSTALSLEDEALLDLLDVDNEVLEKNDEVAAATAAPAISTPPTSTARKRSTGRKTVKDELQYLRAHVQELDQRLRKLKRELREGAEGDASSAVAPSASQWEAVAQRQYAQRQQSQVENARLREALEKQLKVAQSLAKLLRKRPCMQMEAEIIPQNGSCRPCRPPPAATPMQLIDAGRLLATLDAEVLTVDDVFRDLGVEIGSDTVMRDSRVGSNGAGRWAVDLLDCALVPFNVDAAALGCWRGVHHQMKETGAELMAEVTDGSLDDTIALPIHVDITLSRKAVTYSGVFVARKFEQQTRTIVGWKSSVVPTENAADSVLIGETGWVVLEPASTTEQTRRRLALRLSPTVVGNAHKQVGAVFDFIMSAFEHKLTTSLQWMENFSLEATAERSRSSSPQVVTLSDDIEQLK